MTTARVTIRPAVTNHIVKGLIFLGVAGVLAYGMFEMLAPDGGGTMPLGVKIGFVSAFGLVAVLVAFTALRNFLALVNRPSLELTPEGISLQSWRGVFFLGLFLPYYRMRRHVIAWADLQTVQAFTYRVNGIPTEKEIRIFTTQGLVAFGWDVFAPGVNAIQRTTLDFIEERLRADLRASARLPEFQRRRWQETLVFKVPANTPLYFLGSLALAGGFAGYAVTREKGFDVGDWPAFVAFVALYVAYKLASHWWECRGSSHVELRAEGLALGPSYDAIRVIPWGDIQFVRQHTESSGFGSGSKPSLVRLEVRLAGGDARIVRVPDAAALARLSALIEPPLDRVVKAWARISRGESVESAATAEGILPRAEPAPAPKA